MTMRAFPAPGQSWLIRLLSGLRENGLRRLLYAYIPIPSFVFELDVLDGYRVGVRVEIGERLVFRNPASVDVIRKHQLPSFVVYLQDNGFAEILEGNLGPQARAQVPYFVRPFLDFGVVRHSALERDRIVFRPAARLSRPPSIA